MKSTVCYYNLLILILPLPALAGSGGARAGCSGVLDISGSYARAYKFSPSELSSGLHTSGAAQVLYGPSAGYACLGLGLTGVNSQMKYRYHALLEDARSVAIAQFGGGIIVSGEFDFWRILKSMQSFPLSPFIGAEASLGLATNSVVTDRTDDALTRKQNGWFTNYGLRLGMRAHLFRRLGMHVALSQGAQTYTFAGSKLSYQMLRYDAGLSWVVGR